MSTCRIIGRSVFGKVTITAGSITYFNRTTDGYYTIALPMHPAADDVITLPNGTGTVTLNDQSTGAGEYGYAAIYVHLTGGQRVVLAVSAAAWRRRNQQVPAGPLRVAPGTLAGALS